MLLMPFAENRPSGRCGDLDVLQLDQKIKNGEIKQLTVRTDEVVARDRVGNCEFHVSVNNESTRQTILAHARENVDGHPRVEKIEETAQSEVPIAFPVGFIALFCAHILTIFLIMGLMPLYIILAVKDERHDQTMRIVWVILLCMMGWFAMPVYWYLYVWRNSKPSQLAQNPT